MAETQATTEESTTITLAYTAFDLERGTDPEIAAYDLRMGETKPDELDDDMVATVYPDRVSFDVDADVDEHGVFNLLEQVYRGVEHDMIKQVDRTQYRSPMVGDVFVVDDETYVVARIGFEKIDANPDVFESA